MTGAGTTFAALQRILILRFAQFLCVAQEIGSGSNHRGILVPSSASGPIHFTIGLARPSARHVPVQSLPIKRNPIGCGNSGQRCSAAAASWSAAR